MLRRVGWTAILAVVLMACGSSGSGDDGTTSSANGASDTPIGGPFPVADLSVVIDHPDRDTVEYRLTCLGDTATVTPAGVGVDEQAACRALAKPDVVTRLVKGAPEDQMCTEQYGGPDVATITGTIDGKAVDTTIERINGCGISDWDRLLAGVLPPAVGVTD